MVEHNIAPVFDGNSRILILGSFPSVRSREYGFFYGHPQNRFWRVMTEILGWDRLPGTIEEKKAYLLRSGVALWDVIASCDITGSSDASIKNVVPNDIGVILSRAEIKAVYTNGGTAYSLYKKFIFPETRLPAHKLPGTSPANARMSLNDLVREWRVISSNL